MSMPHFTPGDDPGPSLPNLLKRVGLDPYPRVEGPGKVDVPHATTCVAVRYADGVVMAGDRRATAGNLISHRTMEKVLPADRYSGVAIAGAAGPAMEMVKLFQLQLEHYEKVEGVTLSLEGKANQLSAMVRGNLPAAMQGMVVVPIFAGYDTKRRVGRLFDYDVTGGRYEERDHVATGSGSLHAGTVIQVGYREGLSRDEAVDLCVRALWVAADNDSATGGPDPLRGIYPVVATIAEQGFQRVSDDELAERFARIAHGARGAPAMSMPFYVAPEQVMKDRADYARKGIARGRGLVALTYDDGVVMVAENPSNTLRKISEIYDRIAFAGVGKYNEFDQLRVAGVRAADIKGYQYSRDDVDARSLANQYAQILGQVFTHEMKPLEVEILVAEVGVQAGDDVMFHVLYDGTVYDKHRISVLGGDADAVETRVEAGFREGMGLAEAVKLAASALPPPERTLAAGELEAAVLARSNGRRHFRRIDEDEVASLLT